MTKIRENSHVARLSLNTKSSKIEDATEKIRESVVGMINPDAAKLLVALAADIVAGIHSRNDRHDVQAALASLHASIAALDALDGRLDG